MLTSLLSLKIIFYIGLATSFWGRNDPQNPDPNLACYSRPINDEKDFVVAHRTLPCNTPVLVCNARNGKCVKAKVADRGPYGTEEIDNRMYYKAHFDLSPQVAKAISFNGKEEVYVAVLKDLPPPKPKPKKVKYERRNS